MATCGFAFLYFSIVARVALYLCLIGTGLRFPFLVIFPVRNWTFYWCGCNMRLLFDGWSSSWIIECIGFLPIVSSLFDKKIYLYNLDITKFSYVWDCEVLMLCLFKKKIYTITYDLLDIFIRISVIAMCLIQHVILQLQWHQTHGCENLMKHQNYLKKWREWFLQKVHCPHLDLKHSVICQQLEER